MTERHIVETTFYVRYAETDQMGVVHHAEYIVWFEEGRSAWIRALGSNYAEFEASGLYLTVIEVFARYLAPARYGRQVTVRTWREELRSRMRAAWGSNPRLFNLAVRRLVEAATSAPVRVARSTIRSAPSRSTASTARGA